MPKKQTDEEIDREMGEAITRGRELEGWQPATVKTATNARAVYGLRLSASEWRSFTAAAEARGMTLSEFLRAAANAAVQGDVDLDQVAAMSKVREKVRELSEVVGL